MNADQHYLVPRLLMKYVTCAKENLKFVDSVTIFGVGKSFIANEKIIHERKDLILALTRKGAKGEDEFYELKGVIDNLLESLGIKEGGYNEKIAGTHDFHTAMFHPYRVAEITADGKKIGMIGEIHPEIIDQIKSKARIVVAELFVDPLWKLADSEQQYRPVGTYPAIRRDLAIVVPFNTKTEDITNVMEIVGGDLLIDTDLFDYFQDEKMRTSQIKSLAFHLVFESPKRTLTDEEIKHAMQKIITALEGNNWEVKK